MSEPIVAVLVAAGLGVRYGGSTPKAALRMTGRALIAMSIEAMAAGGCTDAVVVLNRNATHHFTSALAGSPIPVSTTLGGATRQESGHFGIQFVENDPRLAHARVVLIHDAVRPMVPAHVVASVIDAVLDGAEAVAPAVSVTDSIRMMGEEGRSSVVDRSSLRAIQTPQGFPLAVISRSHALAASSPDHEFTDDVSCAEAAGYRVRLVEGSRLAMKITEPHDLTVAKSLWKVRASIGHHSGRRVTRRLWGRHE